MASGEAVGTNGGDGGEGVAGAARTLSAAALWIGGVVLVGWGAFIVFLAARAMQEGTSEIQWTRLAWLFSSVEAVVFAAAGAIFGTTVQRQRAESAEKRAEANEKDAASGRALAQAILAEPEADEAQADAAAGAPGGVRTRGFGPAAPERSAAAEVALRHARLARNLFPQRP